MRHFYYLCLSLFLCAVCCTQASARVISDNTKKTTAGIAVHNRQSTPAKMSAFATPTIGQNTSAASRVKSNYEDPDSITSSSVYGFLVGPDGKDWMFTQNFTLNGYFYESTEITLFNGEYETVGTISFNVADLGISNSTACNQIEPYGIVTTKFFDKSSATYEVLVFIHCAGSEEDGYTGSTGVYVFNNNNELVTTLDGSNAALLDVTGEAKDQRLLVVRSATNDEEESVYEIDVLEPASYYNSYTPAVVHTFSVPYDNTIAALGQYCNAYSVDGEAYYALSYYEQPYYTGEWDDNYQMLRTDDNNYIIEVYNGDFEQQCKISIPVYDEEPDNAYRCLGFGYLSNDDITIGRFTNDDDINLIVSVDDYYYYDDADFFSFYVYNSKGEKVKTIIENIDSDSNYKKLADVKGQEEQWMFGKTVDDVTTLEMIDIPSCTTAASIPSDIDGYTVTTYMNRYPTDDGSYQYVIPHSSYTQDEDGNIYTYIGWYDRDLNLVKMVSFNITENGLAFIPNVNETTLDPYFFNTDEGHEYVFFTYQYDEVTGKNLPYLHVADDDGNIVATYTYTGEWTSSYTMSASFPNYDSDNPALLVSYYNYDTKKWDIELIDLPFEKFAAGGDGTESNPYLVSTLGDLRQIATEPTAYYKQTNSIYMGAAGSTWTPVESFSGSYDGDGYNLSGMVVESDDYYAGMFGLLESGASVKNIIFDSPEITVNSETGYAGVVAGWAYANNTIDNIHVHNASITSTDGSTVNAAGGIVGEIYLSGTITSSSFNNGTIDLPGSESVGGIAGGTRTSASITACAVSATINASTDVGGIVGKLGRSAGEVADCHANVDITAKNTVGGIAGSSQRSAIARCYAEGTITASEEDKWGDGFLTGGIIGSLAPDYYSSTTAVVENCLANLSSITTAEDAEAENLTVGRIVGYSTDTDADCIEAGYTEKGLASNYANSEMTINGETITDSDATDSNGESKDEADFTRAFFTDYLAFVYGETVAEPWKENSEGLPLLYFEGENLTDEIKAVPSTGGSSLTLSDGAISSENAKRIDVYSVSGMRIAGAKGSTLNTSALKEGIYVVVVTTADGKKISKKMAVR